MLATLPWYVHIVQICLPMSYQHLEREVSNSNRELYILPAKEIVEAFKIDHCLIG